MKLHSRTEKATFFLEELCEIFCKQWTLMGLIAIVWLSILAQNESSLFLAFFTGFHTALTVVLISTMVYEYQANSKAPSLVQRFSREQRHWPEVHVGSAAFCVT